MRITLIIDEIEYHEEEEPVLVEQVIYGNEELSKTTLTFTEPSDAATTWRSMLNTLVIGVEKHYGYRFDLEKL